MKKGIEWNRAGSRVGRPHPAIWAEAGVWLAADLGSGPSDPRSRRRRTIDPNQLALLEEGDLGHAYAYSFTLTSLDWEATELEAWFRMRALVEEKLKDAKLGPLRHLPSGVVAVNRTWMWSAFLALNTSTFLQSLCGRDTGPDGRARGKRLRRELIAVPGRVLRHANRLVLRVAPEQRDGAFADAWATLLAMASFAGP